MARGVVAVQVGKFALTGAIALAVVGLGTSIASRRIGEREAVAEARTRTLIKAQGLIEPVLDDALLTGAPEARARLDARRADVMTDQLVRMKLWSAAGTVVYSDEPQLIGVTYGLGNDQRESIETGRIEAEVSDLSGPENRFERSYGKLLEVYLPVRTVDIYPPDFGEEPLDVALGDLVERVRARGLAAELEVQAAEPIPDHAARLVYRVAQEGIRNALNHAGASTVRVRLSTGDGRATVEVSDDGRGFDDAEADSRAASGHVGLRALSGLVGDNGGSLQVDSVPGSGTTLRAEVPW